MNVYGEQWRAHLRLTILKLLADAPSYQANESILHDAIIALQLGFRLTRDQVRGELIWLAEQDLTFNEEIAGLLVATAKKRGLDVAAGIVSQPGIKRPSARG